MKKAVTVRVVLGDTDRVVVADSMFAMSQKLGVVGTNSLRIIADEFKQKFGGEVTEYKRVKDSDEEPQYTV